MKREGHRICTNAIELNLLHIYEAKKRISPLVRRTPLVKSNPLSTLFNHDIYLKLEFLQDPGAFKVRGATNKILSLSPTERKRGVITFSTGNHGLCTCWVAKKTDTPVVVCVSKRVAKLSPKRIEYMKALGAEVIVSGDTQDEAGEMAKELVSSRGLTLIHPFDDPFIIAGQGTIGLELLEDEPSISSVFVPLSGGGLISGIALAIKSASPNIKVIGVSIENAPVMYESIKAGHPVEMKEVDSIAESLLGGIGLENKYTFEMVRNLVDEIVLVSEEEIENALSFTLENHHWLLEGAGVAGIAALLSNKASGAGKAAIILSGSNCEARFLLEKLQI